MISLKILLFVACLFRYISYFEQESKMANVNERTYIMIKPDGVQRGLVGEIIKRFEQRGYHLVALKLVHVIFPSSISHSVYYKYIWVLIL